MTPLAQSRNLSRRGATLSLAAGSLWYFPGRFSAAKMLGPNYGLRCVLFHHISDSESSFTKGLGITISQGTFDSALRFLTRHYTPVSLEQVIAGSDGEQLPPHPVLLTFDDSYASVREIAAPLCIKYRVSPVFFVNGSCIGNDRLALENLVCYVYNEFGVAKIRAAIRESDAVPNIEVNSLAEVFSRFLPQASFSGRERFHSTLISLTGVSEAHLARQANLYLSGRQLRDLAGFNFEIGNHTFSHANCRNLPVTDFAEEVDKNKQILETISGTRVRAFSVPYGSSCDLTRQLVVHLDRMGYKAIFLAEGRTNPSRSINIVDRISIKAGSNQGLFSEVEVLPRIRTLWDGVRRRNRRSATTGCLIRGADPLGCEENDVESVAPATGSEFVN
jgi:peptidoglycan/xylan/chitin deacetylase (PgdA/CDA1 family)